MGSFVGNVVDVFTGADDVRNAAAESAAQTKKAAKQAAWAQAFRPIGFTNVFGSSQFETEIDPKTGLPRVTSAGYTISPELKAMQERLMGMAPGALDQAEAAQAFMPSITQGSQSLFNLGQQYVSESPEAARQRYFNQQQALLEQPRLAEEQRLASSVFGRGRAGLNIASSGQPELTSLAIARRQQDLGLAASAEEAAQRQAQFGQGLMAGGIGLMGSGYGLQSQALGPLQSYLGQISSIEQLGMQPYERSLELARMQSGIGGAAAGTQAAGIASAAQQQARAEQQASAMNAAFLQAAISAAAGVPMGGGGGTSPSSLMYNGQSWGGTPGVNPWYG